MKPNQHDARFHAARTRPRWAERFSDLRDTQHYLHAAINKRGGIEHSMEWNNVCALIKSIRARGDSPFRYMRERTRWYSAQPNERLTTYRRILVRGGVK